MERIVNAVCELIGHTFHPDADTKRAIYVCYTCGDAYLVVEGKVT